MPLGGEKLQSPQLENGYTRIANEILEAMAKTDLNGTQRRIIDVVLRQTYGFQRKEHEISLTFLSSATDIHKMQIQRELASLIDRKILIVVKEATFNKSRILTFNKNYKEWSNSGQLAKKLTGSEIDNHTVSEKANTTVSELANQIKKKENIKEIYDYYLSLDLIKHRAYTEDMARSIKKAMKNNKYDIEYCKTLLRRHAQVVDKTKDTEYPVKARGLSEFFGQKVWGATHLICSEYDEGGKYYEQYIKESEEVKKPTEPFVPKFKYFDL